MSGVLRAMQDEHRRGSNYTRDCIISMVVGLQNKQGNKVGTQEYKAYQKVLELIESELGDFMSE